MIYDVQYFSDCSDIILSTHTHIFIKYQVSTQLCFPIFSTLSPLAHHLSSILTFSCHWFLALSISLTRITSILLLRQLKFQQNLPNYEQHLHTQMFELEFLLFQSLHRITNPVGRVLFCLWLPKIAKLEFSSVVILETVKTFEHSHWQLNCVFWLL